MTSLLEGTGIARRLPIVLILISTFLVVHCSSASRESIAPGSQTAPDRKDSADYLPLALGNKWVLKSSALKSEVVLEVTEQSGNTCRLRFDNPWIKSDLVIVTSGGRYYVTSVTVNGNTAQLPKDTLYFDMNAAQGTTWSNEIGNLTLTTREKTVRTSQQTYARCIQIDETNKKGDRLVWVFAPGVGFVQFGADDWAFVLDVSASSFAEKPARFARDQSQVSKAPAGLVLIGLSSNPFANETFTTESVRTRFDQSVQVGISFIYTSPKWSELEPRPFQYNFAELDSQIERSARSNLPVVCDLRIVDSNRRSVPADLMKQSFMDHEMRRRLDALLNEIVPRLKDRVKWMMIGNEIDAYFKNNQLEINDYSELYKAAARRIKDRAPEMKVGATIAFDGLPLMDSLLKPVIDQTDFLALTYYPVSSNFKVRDPETVDGDFRSMVRAARGKKILLQEVGYPSSSLNGSSEQKQAGFVKGVFKNLETHREAFIGANFFLMSDLPDWMVNQFARYYSTATPEEFKAFLRSLGMFKSDGNPKQSWNVFRTEINRLNDSRSR